MAHNDNGVSTGTVIVSFLAGAALGSALALLYAPKSGRETREQIADLADDAVEKIKEYTKEAQTKLVSAFEEGQEAIREKKSILASAIEAGREAIQKEKSKLAS
ncbi:MAG: YtxH domain-containing protein [Geobacter sp.]|jgi:gas vesicle protein|uniref:YtxH domain-containing protein n=1 Tax=Trichlorobacter sp. TaxID=2911007 RepID=UPI002A371DC0|nr:YtxH domain-containing protein [Trichlorobacter sp.]MDY0384618.1 YtxH domain-containing protein [Trichlorobacter sp.]